MGIKEIVMKTRIEDGEQREKSLTLHKYVQFQQ